MTELILFHHAQGLTDGVRAFADRLRDAGHRVALPDLYDGVTFGSVDEGVAHAEALGFDRLIAAGAAAAEELPEAVVYAGFSLGALLAHKLAQTRPGAIGALLYHHGDVPINAFGDSWPDGVDLQIHVNEGDEFCRVGVARAFVDEASPHAQAELLLYPGSTHLFTDASLPDYEPASAALVLERSLDFLQRYG